MDSDTVDDFRTSLHTNVMYYITVGVLLPKDGKVTLFYFFIFPGHPAISITVTVTFRQPLQRYGIKCG